MFKAVLLMMSHRVRVIVYKIFSLKRQSSKLIKESGRFNIFFLVFVIVYCVSTLFTISSQILCKCILMNIAIINLFTIRNFFPNVVSAQI